MHFLQVCQMSVRVATLQRHVNWSAFFVCEQTNRTDTPSKFEPCAFHSIDLIRMWMCFEWSSQKLLTSNSSYRRAVWIFFRCHIEYCQWRYLKMALCQRFVYTRLWWIVFNVWRRNRAVNKIASNSPQSITLLQSMMKNTGNLLDTLHTCWMSTCNCASSIDSIENETIVWMRNGMGLADWIASKLNK